MKNPFRLTKARPVSFADGFTPAARAVWDSLTHEERVCVMLDMSTGPHPPILHCRDGKNRALCSETLGLVVEVALGMTPDQFSAIASRLKARFEASR